MSSELVLICADGRYSAKKERLVLISDTVRLMIEVDPNCKTISFPPISSNIMKIITNYCTAASKCKAAEDLEKLNADFQKEYADNSDKLYDLCVAADYLNSKGLMDLTSEMVADMVKGKEPSVIREKFGIENVYTKEEEEEQRKEREAWPLEFR